MKKSSVDFRLLKNVPDARRQGARREAYVIRYAAATSDAVNNADGRFSAAC